VSHRKGATQSLAEPHWLRQEPLVSHLYGVQSCVVPVAPVVVCSPSHVAEEMHLLVVTSHVLTAAQSASWPQLALHAVGPHAYGAQGTVAGDEQVPLPSHFPAAVAAPAEHAAVPHVTLGPTKPLHALRSVPSQRDAEHGLSLLPCAHAARP